jgi:hypothetical protein
MKKKTTSRTRSKKTRARITSVNKKARTRIKTRHGAMDIQNGLGGMKTARAIARSLKKAADASDGIKTAPFTAAMAALDHMIAFLDRQKERLEAARIELRKLYGEMTDDVPARRSARFGEDEYRHTAAKARGKRSGKRGTDAAPSFPWRDLGLLPT